MWGGGGLLTWQHNKNGSTQACTVYCHGSGRSVACRKGPVLRLAVFRSSLRPLMLPSRCLPAAVVVSFFFLASLFLSPIIASIPPYATGPALVLVGTILLGHIAHIEWDDIGVAIPAFLTMVLMPFTYSGAGGGGGGTRTGQGAGRLSQEACSGQPAPQQCPCCLRHWLTYVARFLPSKLPSCSGIRRDCRAGELPGHPRALLAHRLYTQALVA